MRWRHDGAWPLVSSHLIPWPSIPFLHCCVQAASSADGTLSGKNVVTCTGGVGRKTRKWDMKVFSSMLASDLIATYWHVVIAKALAAFV